MLRYHHLHWRNVEDLPPLTSDLHACIQRRGTARTGRRGMDHDLVWFLDAPQGRPRMSRLPTHAATHAPPQTARAFDGVGRFGCW